MFFAAVYWLGPTSPIVFSSGVLDPNHKWKAFKISLLRMTCFSFFIGTFIRLVSSFPLGFFLQKYYEWMLNSIKIFFIC